MSAAKHTPGPWKRDGQGRTISSSQGVICECWSHMGVDEADANENLIAAAPDLLAALSEMLDQHQNGVAGISRPCAERAQAALAAAGAA